MSDAIQKEKEQFQHFRESMEELLQKPKNEFTYRDFDFFAAYSFRNACYEYWFNHDKDKFLTLMYSVPSNILASYGEGELHEDNNQEIRGDCRRFSLPSAYCNIYYALCGKNFSGAKELAQLYLDTGLFEKEFSYTEQYCYGYCMMYLLTNDQRFWTILKKLRRKKAKNKPRSFGQILEAITEHLETKAQEGLNDLVKTMNLSWEDPHTGFINTWALALANLCRLHGLMVHETKQRVPPSLIPKELVTPQVPEELLVTPEEVKAVLEKDPALGQLPPQ